MNISVIIPIFNEEKTIGQCLTSIVNQSLEPYEVIVVDDGSTDKSVTKVKSQKSKVKSLILFTQNHGGPGQARDYGASKATGDILVFVDGDMTFDKHFLQKLTEPIRNRKVKGTFTKDELVSNWENVWARCWNFNQHIFENRRIPANYPDEAPVFRSILRSEFYRVGGFDPIGYTDDWTLSRKLGYQARVAPGAICYHRNPDSLQEVFRQARWIGKNEFMTGTLVRKIYNLLRFGIPVSVVIGVIKSVSTFTPVFFLFKLVYDAGIFISVVRSFAGEKKNK